MFKHISILSVLLFSFIVFLNGCDIEAPEESSTGCDSGTYDYSSDQIEFTLPPSTGTDIAGYLVELQDPITKKTLGSQEGEPGETLIFTLDRPKIYVRAMLTAMDSSGAVLAEAQAAVVDVDVMTPICEVTVDTAVVIDSDQTAVDVNVKCFGIEFADVHVDSND